MDFAVHYTTEQEEFRLQVRTWLESNVPAELVDSAEHDEPPERYLLRRELGRRLGELGWLYPLGSPDFGGGGLQLDSALVLIEEMQRVGLSLPPYYDSGGAIGSVAIQVWGTDEQKRALLPPIYRGEQRTWQLLTEPGAGSDVAAVSTRAVREGDSYRITGEKVFIGSANGADGLWTLVRTGPPAARHHNLSWFMIDADTPGITITPMRLIGGTDKNAVHFDGVQVPAFNLVGGENQGWTVATTHLELEHGLRGDHLIGQRLERYWQALLAEWHARRPTSPVAASPHARDLLVQAYIRKEVVRLLGVRNFWLASGAGELTYEGPQGYLVEKTTTQWLAAAMIDVLGLAAVVQGGDSKTAELVTAAQAGSIYEMHGGGTAEIQKLVIARRLGLGQRPAEASGRLR
jgi:alkylation response protein AidB-like acyl-CoA dehydrogenase